MAGKKYSRMLILLGEINVEAFEFIGNFFQENPMNNIPRIANEHRKNSRVRADITCSSEGTSIKCLESLYTLKYSSIHLTSNRVNSCTIRQIVLSNPIFG